MLTITITDPPFSFVADTTETVLNFTVSDQVGPSGTTLFSGLTDKATADIPTINTPLANALSGKQVTLVSGTNIKTINGTSLLGSGNIEVGSSYTLPIATDSVLGGIKSSTDILVDGTTGVATVNATTGEDGGAVAGKMVKFKSDGSIMRLFMTDNLPENAYAGTINTGSDLADGGSINTTAGGTFMGGSINTSGTATLAVFPFTQGRSGGQIDTTSGGSIIMGSGSLTTGDGNLTGPNTDGTIALTSDLAAYQTTAGTLALGGFSSITGTLAISNIGGLGTGVGTALAQNANSASGFITQSGADSRYGDKLFAFKSSDTSRSSTTTFADDPHLTLAIPSAGTWEITAIVAWSNADGTGGLKSRLNYTGTWTTADSFLNYRYFVSSGGVTEGTGYIGYYKGSALANPQTIVASTIRSAYIIMEGQIKLTTSGTLSIQWAQNASSATASVIPQGAYIMARRVA